MIELGRIETKDFVCVIIRHPDGHVSFLADADIDADGANGQNGKPAAYTIDDKGSDKLANGGMKIINGKVICAHAWARSVVILGPDNQPKVFNNGVIASKTWYRYPQKKSDDHTAYVDSETVAYIVIPPLIEQSIEEPLRGAKAKITYRKRSVDCVVADIGPSKSIGELSIAAARMLGIPASPRSGGISTQEVLYEIWPGVQAAGFELLPS